MSDRCACGVALKSRLGQAYNEEAFQYLLALERTRSERSGRSLLLLLVDLKERPAASVRLDPAIARKLFSSLWLSLRETDVIGWHRDERVVGAVLPEFRDAPGVEASPRLLRRVHAMLCERLSQDVAGRLQVRVYQHPAPEMINSASPQITGAELLMGEI